MPGVSSGSVLYASYYAGPSVGVVSSIGAAGNMASHVVGTSSSTLTSNCSWKWPGIRKVLVSGVTVPISSPISLVPATGFVSNLIFAVF